MGEEGESSLFLCAGAQDPALTIVSDEGPGKAGPACVMNPCGERARGNSRNGQDGDFIWPLLNMFKASLGLAAGRGVAADALNRRRDGAAAAAVGRRIACGKQADMRIEALLV